MIVKASREQCINLIVLAIFYDIPRIMIVKTIKLTVTNLTRSEQSTALVLSTEIYDPIDHFNRLHDFLNILNFRP